MKKILPPKYFYISIIVIVFLHLFFPVAKISKLYFTVIIGLFLVLAGVILNIWADHLFKKYKTDVKPTVRPSALIKEGPYKISRNPMYLGMLAILIGIVLILGSVSPFVSPLFFFAAMNFWIIPREENIMKKVFENVYLDYKKKVRRWI